MTRRVVDLTTGELERLVETTVRRTIEDSLETLEALSSASYLESVREAREDYQSGTITNLADLRDVIVLRIGHRREIYG